LNNRLLSDSITYSGGQASSGQGGFYGSGGSRVVSAAPEHHPEALARQADITELASIMNQIENMEIELATLGSAVTTRSIELKSAMSKAAANPNVLQLITTLEIKGEPVWGLSSKERDLVRKARAKYTGV
jgi:hypothetical protein